VVNKYRLNAFLFSDLEHVLRVLSIDTLIITGVVTNGGCLLTAMDAFQRGFEVIMVSDCCAARSEESHLMGLNYLKPFAKILTANEALKLFERA
jgi:isochorismate hydrolase